MKVLVTGGSGFLGRAVITSLRQSDHDVVALVRDATKAAPLQQQRCTTVSGTVNDFEILRNAAQGCDALIHLAGIFKVGVPESEHEAMRRVNVDGTRTVIEAGEAAEVQRIVHVSTINVFGDTHGAIVDETFVRNPADGFNSCYDETKYQAHRVALEKAAAGAPVVVVQPGLIYGPGDHSDIGEQIRQTARGRLPVCLLASMGLTMVHVEDAAEGVLHAMIKGETGRAYVLGGELVRLRGLLDLAAEVSGKRRPLFEIPALAVKAMAPLGPKLFPRFGYSPNVREMIRVADRTTYWASDTRARTELGYTTRDLRTGLRETLIAEGLLN